MTQPTNMRRLNEPQPIRVSSDAAHRPTAVQVAGTRKAVGRVADMWIVQEGWWYSHSSDEAQPSREINRQYFKVVLDDGQIMTIFRDRVNDRWFEQDYTDPVDIAGDEWTEQ